MKYKVGDQVVVEVERQKSGNKRVVSKDPAPDSTITEKAFPIVIKNEIEQSYTIIVDDDISGWYISMFHVKHAHVNEKYLSKRFHVVTEEFILRKK